MCKFLLAVAAAVAIRSAAFLSVSENTVDAAVVIVLVVVQVGGGSSLESIKKRGSAGVAAGQMGVPTRPFITRASVARGKWA